MYLFAPVIVTLSLGQAALPNQGRDPGFWDLVYSEQTAVTHPADAEVNSSVSSLVLHTAFTFPNAAATEPAPTP